MTTQIVAATIAATEMHKHGLLPRWSIQFDRAKRRAGYCDYTHRVISLSLHFVERNGPEEILETVRHEIAHALVGHDAGHGWQWKLMAVKVGAKPERCYDASEVDMPKGNVISFCCGKEFRQHRMPRRNARSYKICPRCRNRLNWRRLG